MKVSLPVIERAREWVRHDPNPTTASSVRNLLTQAEANDEKASEELSNLFPEDGSRIGFGTAGLRSKMKPGPLGMNDLVIVQTAQGLVRYCEAHPPTAPTSADNKERLRVVVGYDHRANPALNLSSLSFALITALVLEHAGLECVLLDGYVHTPLVSFATRFLQAAAGVMVTASHNPKDDNGYKVYWNDGCQIRSPLDKGIADSILQNLTPWTDYREKLQHRRSDFTNDSCLGLSNKVLTKKMKASYADAIVKSGLITGQAKLLPDMTLPPSFVYSAMHGIGLEPACKVFDVFGLPPLDAVPSQAQPDPNFPTVSFPNPEEKGAFDIAKSYACEKQCDIVLANDPDADRLAVAERDRDTGSWTVFTGDQIGVMLGHWLWEMVGKPSGRPVAMCSSTVSSQMLAEIARVEGFHHEDVLTGFKWIGSRLETLSREQGYFSLFGYEEAIGFCCGDVVFDKDGITAMAVFAELAVHVYHKGSTLARHMQSLYDKYGEFVSNNGYYFCYKPESVKRIVEGMRNGGKYMTHVAGYEIESVRDLGEPGYDSTRKDKRPLLPTSASSPIMTLTFKNGCVTHVRASGTEPKVKYYIEMKGKPGVARDVVQNELQVMSESLLRELLQPEKNGLMKPNAS